jgi:type I restriction enzyme S subunit
MNQWKETYIGTIPIDWNIFNLGDLGEFKNGINFSREDFGKGYPVINVKNLFDGRFASTMNLDEVLKDRISNSSSYLLNRKDILFARSSVTVEGAGQVSMIDKLPLKECVYSGFIIRFRITKQDIIYPDFLNYLLRSSKYRSYLVKVASGTAIINLSQDSLKNIPIHVPSLHEQKQIADVLSCLDTKIENLRRQNETLEQIAQTLFKHWFIDFEFPNADGKPYKSSGGAMVASELGDIPKGWEIGKLSDIVVVTDYVANGSFASLKENVTTYESENYAIYIRLVDYNNAFSSNLKYVDKHSFDFLAKAQLKGNEVIVSNIGANAGTIFRPPYWLRKPMVLGSNSIVFYSENFTEYLYSFLHSHQGKLKLQGIIGGSAQPKFNKTDFRNIELIIPDIAIVKLFNNLAINIRDKIFNNNGSIQTLTKTRDSLLPKLMSGQLRVKE